MFIEYSMAIDRTSVRFERTFVILMILISHSEEFILNLILMMLFHQNKIGCSSVRVEKKMYRKLHVSFMWQNMSINCSWNLHWTANQLKLCYEVILLTFLFEKLAIDDKLLEYTRIDLNRLSFELQNSKLLK